jgi:hypothetical protein
MASSKETVRLLDVAEVGDDCFLGYSGRSSPNAQEGPVRPRGELRLRLGVDR